MIGQKKNIETLINWRLNKSIPRFIIIEGEEGSGRLTLSKLIGNIIGNTVLSEDNSKDSVNNIIEMSYTVNSPTLYIFRNVENMSVQAKNALLKVVEEPPNKSYFIMTINDLSNMLETIISRATVVHMYPYSMNELENFSKDVEIIKYNRTPGKILNSSKTKVEKAVTSAKDCVNYLNLKSGTKLLKTTYNLNSKQTEDDSKIDCYLFLNAFIDNLYNIDCTKESLLQILEIVEKCKKEFKVNAINKKACLEVMLINILRVLKDAQIS